MGGASEAVVVVEVDVGGGFGAGGFPDVVEELGGRHSVQAVCDCGRQRGEVWISRCWVAALREEDFHAPFFEAVLGKVHCEDSAEDADVEMRYCFGGFEELHSHSRE